MDIETIDRMRYYFSDLPDDDDALAFDAIQEVAEEGSNFITVEHTFERCRMDPWFSTVSVHDNGRGNPNEELYASAQKRIEKVLEEYEYPTLSQEKRDALDAIMRKLGMKEKDIAKV